MLKRCHIYVDGIDIITTSFQSHDKALTSVWCHFKVMCLLGCLEFQDFYINDILSNGKWGWRVGGILGGAGHEGLSKLTLGFPIWRSRCQKNIVDRLAKVSRPCLECFIRSHFDWSTLLSLLGNVSPRNTFSCGFIFTQFSLSLNLLNSFLFLFL